MSQSETQAAEANDGEQDDNNDAEQYADVPARIVEPHEGIGTRNAAKVGFARMLTEWIHDFEDERGGVFDGPTAEDIQWAEGSANSLTDGETVGLAEEAVDRSRRPIWVFQVFNQLIRAVCTDADGEVTEVSPDNLDSDRFQRMYEEYQDVFMDAANHLSVNNLNEGLRSEGFHPESFLAPEPATGDGADGPRDDVYVTPSGLELDADAVEDVSFDPQTGQDLSEVDIKTERQLAEMSDDEVAEYLDEDADYEPPEMPEVESGSQSDEADEAQAETEEEPDDLTSISGIGEASAEALEEAGYTTVEDIIEATPEELQEAGLNAGTVGQLKNTLEG